MYDEKLIEYATKRAEYKAKQVTKQVPALGDVEDIMQELLLDVLERLPKYDGDRAGMRTFVCRIMNNKVADLFKPYTAACRGGGQTMESLDDYVPGEDGEPAHVALTHEETRRRLSAVPDVRVEWRRSSGDPSVPQPLPFTGLEGVARLARCVHPPRQRHVGFRSKYARDSSWAVEPMGIWHDPCKPCRADVRN